MASRGMSLKKKKKRQQPSPFAQTYHATSGRSSRLLWVLGKNRKKKEQKICTASSQDRIQHCLYSTCCGVEMFTTLGHRFLFWLHRML